MASLRTTCSQLRKSRLYLIIPAGQPILSRALDKRLKKCLFKSFLKDTAMKSKTFNKWLLRNKSPEHVKTTFILTFTTFKECFTSHHIKSKCLPFISAHAVNIRILVVRPLSNRGEGLRAHGKGQENREKVQVGYPEGWGEGWAAERRGGSLSKLS